ncbi:hypothetical protein BO70DRAFT_363789 [Aspergillus heteromorphus CBS 117.55]|uniref:Uncharacterized protein n=1 Tax=Aspergillus heteromorphus CBS 117.55 TaxID=1448321 RepID=A0A317VPD6_9EURO|nr:uncharacterized protein BO70DRAFT_363789 [Aspergillus heteromorphus CBS 117.55]PWY76216.1 hypothetical protein BO70DRAFT_363789 [Aspergillus heteromorphus CBS 117.55]
MGHALIRLCRTEGPASLPPSHPHPHPHPNPFIPACQPERHDRFPTSPPHKDASNHTAPSIH